MMIRENNINFNSLKEKKFDSILSKGSGVEIIFGNFVGVMEAAVRAAYHLITKKEPSKKILDFKEVRGYNNIKTATIEIADHKLRLLVVHGCSTIEPLLKELE